MIPDTDGERRFEMLSNGAAPSAERKAFLLRLPKDLIDDLRDWAEAEFRSMNGQMEFVLREALTRRSQ